MADGCTSVDFGVPRSFEAVVNTSFNYPDYVATDLNGDGKPDLAVTDAITSSVQVFLNDGFGNLGVPAVYFVEAAPRAIKTADFNGDGRPDLVVANSQSNTISVLQGTGGGAFNFRSDFVVGSDPRAIAITDLNNDGKLDLAVGNTGTSNVTLLLGNGLASFSAAPGSPFSVEGQVSSLAATDTNSDGKRDLIVGTYSGSFLLLGNGLGGFNSEIGIYPPASYAVAAADVNNDAKVDLIIGSFTGLVISLNDGNGGFNGTTVTPNESGASIVSVAVTDLDGDGKQDVVAATEFAAGFTFFKGNGAGGFTTTPSYLPSNGVFNFTLVDFDLDGDTDVIAGNSILMNLGGAVFDAPRGVYAQGGVASAVPQDMAFGDFNGDGRSDMAVIQSVQQSSQGRVAILLRSASGTFSFSSALTVFLGGFTSLTSADFNHDGRADLAIAGTFNNPFQHVVWVSLSNPDGTFPTPTMIGVVNEPYDIAAGDMNGDTHQDLVVMPRSAPNFALLLNNGSGSFSLQFGPTGGATFPRVAIADLNGDTKLDLVTSDFFGLKVFVTLGNGNGTFLTPISFVTPGAASAVTVGDFNVDTKPDVAVANYGVSSDSEGTVSILLGDGAGSLGTPTNYPVGANPANLINSDLDGDGKLDLAASNADSSTIIALSGDGSGNFRSPVSFAVWGGPGTLAVDDFNSDGRADLAVTLFRSAAVGILYGKPANSQPCLFADDAAFNEGSAPGTVDIPIRLSQASAQVVKVNYLLKNSGATEGQDYTGVKGTVTFQPGEVAKTVPVTILPDGIDENPEFFNLILWGAVNGRLSDGVARVTLTDDDPPPTLSINDVTVTEVDSSFSVATFTVSLSTPSSHTVSVALTTASGTALAESDFTTTNGGVFFGVGETTKTFAVGIIGDRTFEPDETFFVNLSSPVDATIADGQGQGLILNNDPTPSIIVLDVTLLEPTGVDINFNVIARLSNPSSQTITVDFNTTDGSAVAGADYIATSGTVTFNPGETDKNIPLTVKGDAVDEASETFLVNLSNPVNATISDSQATVNITDNDGPSASINDVTVTEGQSGFTIATFTVTLSAASPQAVSMRAVTANGTATGFFDYQTITNRIITIPAGSTSATMNVNVVGDLAIESTETFFVNLSLPQNCTIGDAQGVGTIIDDDITSAQFGAATMSVE